MSGNRDENHWRRDRRRQQANCRKAAGSAKALQAATDAFLASKHPQRTHAVHSADRWVVWPGRFWVITGFVVDKRWNKQDDGWMDGGLKSRLFRPLARPTAGLCPNKLHQAKADGCRYTAMRLRLTAARLMLQTLGRRPQVAQHAAAFKFSSKSVVIWFSSSLPRCSASSAPLSWPADGHTTRGRRVPSHFCYFTSFPAVGSSHPSCLRHLVLSSRFAKHSAPIAQLLCPPPSTTLLLPPSWAASAWREVVTDSYYHRRFSLLPSCSSRWPWPFRDPNSLARSIALPAPTTAAASSVNQPTNHVGSCPCVPLPAAAPHDFHLPCGFARLLHCSLE